MKIYRVGIAAILEIEAVNETAVSNVLSSLYSDGGLTRHRGPWPGVESVAFFMCDQDGTIEELPEDEGVRVTPLAPLAARLAGRGT